MATVLFALWAGGGNVNPFLGLADELRARGHRVAAVASAGLTRRLAAAGIDPVIGAAGWLPTAAETAESIAAVRPDALVVDYMLTEALCAAEASGLPTVALVHTLFGALVDDGAPFPMYMAGPVARLNAAREPLGLAPIAHHRDLLDAASLVMITAPAELDQPSSHLPAHAAYVGALFEGPGPDAGWRPPPGDGPVVAVSMGTAGDGAKEGEALARVFAAVDGLPARVVVTVPDYHGQTGLNARAPANATLSPYVRHSALLRHADAFVTHAGLGSVVAALAFGVPMACLPLERDQPANAAAVERLGAGRALATAASADEIRAAVVAQLERRDRVTIAPDPARAGDLVEAAL